MVKVGRLVPPELQLCYVHAVHLVVTDVLYHRDIPCRVIKMSDVEEDSDLKSDESAECDEDGYRSVKVREDMYKSVEQVGKIECMHQTRS